MTKISLILLSLSLGSYSLAFDCPEGSSMKESQAGELTVKECISDKSGKQNGPSHQLDKSGVLRRSSVYNEGVLNGPFKVYTADKKLVREGQFENGRLNGVLKRWYPNGQLQDEVFWFDGRPHGDVTRFYPDGKVQEEGRYRTGIRIGTWTSRDENGDVTNEKDHGSYSETLAVNWTAEVSVKGPRRGGFSWVKRAVVEIIETRQGDFTFVARLHAHVPDTGWVVEYEGEEFETWDRENKSITVDVPLTGNKTVVTLVASDPEHEGDTYRVTLTAPEYELRKAELLKDPPRASYFLVAASLNSISYTEGTTIDSSMTSVGVQLAYRRVIGPPNWDIDLGINYSGSALSSTGNEPPTYLGVNARVGYILTNPKARWTVSLMGGMYVRSATSESKDYGYGTLAGPQLYPYISRRIGTRQTGFGYLKYSPLFSGSGLLAGSNSEVAAGLGWLYTLRSGRVMGVLVDYTNLTMTSSNFDLSNSATSVSFAYGF